jgi:type I restriction enzyme S subunit
MHVTRLGEVCEINPRMPKSLADDDAASFLPMAAVSEEGQIAFEEQREVGEVKKGYTYFERGDVLVAKITPCFENGKAARTLSLSNPIGFGSTEFHVLRAGEEIDAAYLFHLIWNARFREVGANNMTGSAGQKRVPADFLKRLEIPLPPLDEQRRIAAILDKTDALRRKRKRTLDLLDGLTQSVFLEMFGDLATRKTIRFNETLSRPLRNGISPSKAGKVAAKVLTLSAVTGGAFKPQASKEATFDVSPAQDLRVQKGDFLICRGNGNKNMVGMGVICPISMPDTAFPDTIIAAEIDFDRIQPHYLEDIWSSAFVRRQIEQSARTTNGTFKVNQTMLEGIKLPNPPLSLQREYGARVAVIKDTAKTHEMQLSALDSLFSSLQHRAFTGQL